MIRAIIPTRKKPYRKSLTELIQYFNSLGIDVDIKVGFPSVLSAVKDGLSKLSPNDIVIICHDDIVIQDRHLVERLEEKLIPGVGYVGIAGSTALTDVAIWWENKQFMSGSLYHVDERGLHLAYYGPCKDVVVLDGVFLACRARTLLETIEACPDTGFDYYDISLTFAAYAKGLTNKTFTLNLIHSSGGYRMFEERFEKSKQIFLNRFGNQLPVIL